MKKKLKLFIAIVLLTSPTRAQTNQEKLYHESFRPQIHFSPEAHWMNDPNGMVYFNHTYHLFFQYYPNGTTWGPMHWGHATSKDLMHWKEQPIALYPDSLGYIFSGSAVVDSNNTSGFGKDGKIPLVAIFTHHDPKGEKAGADNFQNESLAYSLDEGKTWTKYSGNPVLKNPGIRDFRDPKVMWYRKQNKWVMTLATKDHITFFSSPDLKNWKKESEFGKDLGAHGGVWECPDLFPLKLNGKTYWVLIVNLNPGGPNGGSATQYFIGQFDGSRFIPTENKLRWLDYGPDEYAGVTWANTGNRKIFLGWMSNWTYANQVPTDKWRNAMTIPRELGLKRIKGEIFVTAEPVRELLLTEGKSGVTKQSLLNGRRALAIPNQFVLKFRLRKIKDYALVLSNSDGNKLSIGYKSAGRKYYIDRTKSSITAFNPQFEKIAYAPRLANVASSNLTLVIDASSVEVFADDGLSVMTAIFFPVRGFDRVQMIKPGKLILNDLRISPLRSIW